MTRVDAVPPGSATPGWAQRWLAATRDRRLLVVGGASLDTIHVRGAPVRTPGGAGLYTALAAARAGVEVTMLAPVPHPVPPELAPAFDRIRWIGPTVGVDDLPRFEIGYDEHGDVTLFREHLGAEPQMTPALLDQLDDLPACAFCVPFLDAELQRSFVDDLARRGCLTVASTYGLAARASTDVVRATFATADLSFCNAREAELLFGAEVAPMAGRHRFVTQGHAGASVFQGDHRTDLPAEPAELLDPTGAGDTFCGTTLARLLRGDHPVEAARRAMAAAAEAVEAIGPAALLRAEASRQPHVDQRVHTDHRVVERLAARVAALDTLAPFEFTGPLFPTVHDAAASDAVREDRADVARERTVEWFATATAQQFGFWHARNGVWAGSMVASIDGIERKGSDHLWAMYDRWARRDPDALSPRRQAHLTETEWAAAASDDDGADPLPASALHLDVARRHGQTLLALGVSVPALVTLAAAHPSPMRSLLTLLDHVGGYREDPLRKKSALLGVILRQRPERFLPPTADDDAPPIVDYHVQRTCLRTGMVTIDDASVATHLAARTIAPTDVEAAVRRASSDAIAALCSASGRDMGTVDWFLFTMRDRCPEARRPDCSRCPADPACAHRIELFQPVVRTTAY